MKKLVRKFAFYLLMTALNSMAHASDAAEKIIPASDGTFLGSVLEETWDTSHAASKGYVDCMMPLSDVDLSVMLKTAGAVKLNFDTSVYAANQAANAGPDWMVEVDGHSNPTALLTVGPRVPMISSPVLEPGTHRVKFVQVGNLSGSHRWSAYDPQLSRVTGVTLPGDASLEKSQRPTSWFLPITDSIGEGALNINPTRESFRTSPAGVFTNAYYAWPSITARLLHKSVAGYLISGIGIVRGGTGAPYGALNAQDPADDPWDHIFSGVARPFTTAPDFILLCIGTNEWATDPNTVGHGNPPDAGSSDEAFATNVETFFARVRAHAQLAGTPIYVSVPFGGFKRTALQKAIASYKAAHPDEAHLELFDLAYGSPALTTTAGVNEVTLFGGLTKNRPDDKDTIPSPQASDRTHPYGIATYAIGSVNAHKQLAQVIAPQLALMLAGGPAPKTGELTAGPLIVMQDGLHADAQGSRATGGSAPYLYQFQTSMDQGKTWTNVGAPIENMQSTIGGIPMTDYNSIKKQPCRLVVTDGATPPARATSDLDPVP